MTVSGTAIANKPNRNRIRMETSHQLLRDHPVAQQLPLQRPRYSRPPAQSSRRVQKKPDGHADGLVAEAIHLE
jgi:hypothetical protein